MAEVIWDSKCLQVFQIQSLYICSLLALYYLHPIAEHLSREPSMWIVLVTITE